MGVKEMAHPATVVLGWLIRVGRRTLASASVEVSRGTT